MASTNSPVAVFTAVTSPGSSWSADAQYAGLLPLAGAVLLMLVGVALLVLVAAVLLLPRRTPPEMVRP